MPNSIYHNPDRGRGVDAAGISTPMAGTGTQPDPYFDWRIIFAHNPTAARASPAEHYDSPVAGRAQPSAGSARTRYLAAIRVAAAHINPLDTIQLRFYEGRALARRRRISNSSTLT